MVKNEAGFTLVELLVGVAIVFVLTSIALPISSEYRKRAYNAHAISYLKQVITHVESGMETELQEAFAADDGIRSLNWKFNSPTSTVYHLGVQHNMGDTLFCSRRTVNSPTYSSLMIKKHPATNIDSVPSIFDIIDCTNSGQDL